MMSEHKLFEEFEPVSGKAWKQKIQVDLKGADYNETLIWDSPEGIKVKPFYTVEDLDVSGDQAQGHFHGFAIGEKIVVEDVAEGRRRCIDALEHGVESLILEINSPNISLDQLLSDIPLSGKKLYLDLQNIVPNQINSMLDDLKVEGATVIVLNDIISKLESSGNWFKNMEKDFAELNELVKDKGEMAPISINVSLYQNAGGNRIQQLAYALAHALEYRGVLENSKIPFITFEVSVDSNYFFEIAKLRALRKLWNRLAAENGLTQNCHILAFPTNRNKTLYDYNVNMLRTTTECMSAMLGEADTVHNTPYDHIYHQYNEFANRIARNQLLILKNESYFDKVSNPASGSYYIEKLTEELSDHAMALFEQIVAGGGFLNQLKQHKIQRKIRESAEKQQKAFEEGKEVLVGSNKYPNEKDLMKDQMQKDPFLAKKSTKTLIEPILEKRLAEQLEKSRLKDE